MIKAKQIFFVNTVVLLALMGAAFVTVIYPRISLPVSRGVPIFAGEEVLVQKTITAIKAERTVMAEKAIRAVRAEAAPTGGIAAPLPMVPPSITYKVLPLYPTMALEKGLEGMVLLSVYVGLNGSPEKVEIKSASGVAEFDQSAVAAVSQWKFEPARQGTGAMASWFEMPVRFSLTN